MVISLVHQAEDTSIVQVWAEDFDVAANLLAKARGENDINNLKWVMITNAELPKI